MQHIKLEYDYQSAQQPQTTNGVKGAADGSLNTLLRKSASQTPSNNPNQRAELAKVADQEAPKATD